MKSTEMTEEKKSRFFTIDITTLYKVRKGLPIVSKFQDGDEFVNYLEIRSTESVKVLLVVGLVQVRFDDAVA